MTKRPMHLSDFALISYTLQCQKKWQIVPFTKGFLQKENLAFHLRKNKFLAILKLECESPNYENLWRDMVRAKSLSIFIKTAKV